MTSNKPHTADDHPTSDVDGKAREIAIDSLIHPLPRLKICATLNNAGAVRMPDGKEMAFGTLRNAVGLSDASLSKHLKALEEAHYVSRFREYGSARKNDTVWVSLTEQGHHAFTQHVTALRAIAGET